MSAVAITPVEPVPMANVPAPVPAAEPTVNAAALEAEATTAEIEAGEYWNELATSSVVLPISIGECAARFASAKCRLCKVSDEKSYQRYMVDFADRLKARRDAADADLPIGRWVRWAALSAAIGSEHSSALAAQSTQVLRRVERLFCFDETTLSYRVREVTSEHEAGLTAADWLKRELVKTSNAGDSKRHTGDSIVKAGSIHFPKLISDPGAGPTPTRNASSKASNGKTEAGKATVEETPAVPAAPVVPVQVDATKAGILNAFRKWSTSAGAKDVESVATELVEIAKAIIAEKAKKTAQKKAG